MNPSDLCTCLLALLLALYAPSSNSQQKANAPWEGAAFSADAKQIAQAAAAIRADEDTEITVLTDDRRVSYDAAGRSVFYSHWVYRVESKEALSWAATAQSTWSPWRQKRPLIRARVIAFDGSTSAELDPKVLTDVAAHDQRPEIYEDQRTLSGPLPAVGVGSIVEMERIFEDTAPLFEVGDLHRFRMPQTVSVLHASFEVDAPANLPLGYKLRGNPAVTVIRREENGRVILRFEQQAGAKYEAPEKDLPSEFDSAPAVDYSTAASWNAVADRYYGVVKDAIRPNEVGPLLEGTHGLKSQELLRRIVTNLHQKVRYTGLEFGWSSMVPRAAGETLKTGYGDCKDKAVVLASALQAAGLPAQIALLKTRGEDDVAPELAGIGQFNHAIVFIPGAPGTWIDATAEFSDPGDLPWEDQGRLALLIGPHTSGLVRTPVNATAQNAQVVRRGFYLSEYGPAKVVETFTPTGHISSNLRGRYGQADTKERRDDLDDYVRREFRAEALTSFEHSAGDDLTKPFQLKLVINKARRGFSDLNSAAVAIRAQNLMWGYPDYVLSDDGKDKPDTPGWKPRKNNIELQPFIAEWRYKIVAPPEYGTPVLPKDAEQAIGPAKLVQHYEVNSDGTVEVLWRFDSVKACYTPAELQSLRRDAHTLLNADAVMINFPEKGAALLADGQGREALAFYNGLTKLHPDSAVDHVLLAKFLLTAGLGEQARKEARAATELDPKSALAWNWLGWMLQHDAIGRRFAKGFDLSGAIAAYRKATELDPKDWTNFADFGILLEHGSWGERYSPDAKLDEAIAQYRKVKEINPDEGEAWDDNILYDLLYSRGWDELLRISSSLPSSSTRKALTVAAIAARDGSQAALAQAARWNAAAGERAGMLKDAAGFLIRLRNYAPALDLMNAALAGQKDNSQLRATIELLRNVQPYEKVLLPESDPRRVIQDYYLCLLKPDSKAAEWYRIDEVYPADQGKIFETDAAYAKRYRDEMVGQNYSLAVARDIVLSNLRFSMEGNDDLGYRIRVVSMNQNPDTMLIAKRAHGYVNVAAVASAGSEVLRRLSLNDFSGAKQWLDWMREQLHLNSGDDPLGGYVFPRFWNRGDDPDPARMRLAALALLVQSSAIREYVPELKSLRAATSDSTAASKIDLLLVRAALQLDDWNLYHEVAPRLLAAYPASDLALNYFTWSAIYTRDWEHGESAVAERLSRMPDDPEGIRDSARLAEGQANFAEARKRLRPIIDSNRASIHDFNRYTWNAVMLGTVGSDDVSLLQRAISGNSNSGFAEIHTLACLYALAGNTKDARELLFRGMDVAGFEEPNDSIWLGFGLIAEQYGMTDVARSLYQRVQKDPNFELPASNYNLAQLRLNILRSGQTAAGGH